MSMQSDSRREADDPSLREQFQRFDGQTLGGSGLGAALLRTPGALIRRLAEEPRPSGLTLGLLANAFLLAGAYGAVLGLFQPGVQTFFAALKIPIVLLGSSLLCTPTLYVFNTLGGSRLTYAQVVGLAVLLAAAISLILAALIPVVAFFTISTGGFAFMTFLHLAVFAVGVGFGLRLLATARSYLRHLDGAEAVGGGVLACWSVLVVLVGLQMAYYFRPILLPGPFFTGERGLFTEFLFR